MSILTPPPRLAADPEGLAWEVFAAGWTERLHPRGPHGEFIHKGDVALPFTPPRRPEVLPPQPKGMPPGFVVTHHGKVTWLHTVKTPRGVPKNVATHPTVVIVRDPEGTERTYDTVGEAVSESKRMAADYAPMGETAGLHGEDFPGEFAQRIAHQIDMAYGTDVKSELRTAHSAAEAGQWESAISHAYKAAFLTGDKHPEQRREIVLLADAMQAGYSAKVTGPGFAQVSRDVHHEADNARRSDDDYNLLQHAAGSFERADWEQAAADLEFAADKSNNRGDHVRGRYLRHLAQRVRDVGLAPPPPARGRGPHPPEWVVKRLDKELDAIGHAKVQGKEPDPWIRGHLWEAHRQLAFGTLGAVPAANSLKSAAARAEELGLHAKARQWNTWAANLEAFPAWNRAREDRAAIVANRKLERFTAGHLAKGGKAMPTILGGGEQAFNGEVTIWPDEIRSDPFVLADIDWSGAVDIRKDVALGVQADTHMRGEPINSIDSWSVPAHEMIHGTIHGRYLEREAKIAAAIKAGTLTADDSHILTHFRIMDRTSADAGAHVWDLDKLERQAPGTERHHGGREGVRAWMESLVAKGLLERSTTTTSISGPDGKVTELGHSYGLTSKGRGLTPLEDPPWAADDGVYNGARENKAIEEGFTELGTVYHMADYFTAMGVARRKTPFLAAEGGTPQRPDPALQNVLLDKLDKLAIKTNAREYAYAARALRKGDMAEAVRWLDSGRGKTAAEDDILKGLQNDLVDVFSKHAVPNPVFDQRQAQLIRHLEQVAAQAEARKADPGEWAPDRIINTGSLEQARAAMMRASRDLEDFDYVGALEEIATVQHLGDHELWTEAMALHAEVDKLTHTSVDRYATAAEYARRLEDPQRIRTAQCWGHYGEETKIALNWCAAVAEAEGLKPDTPGWDRRIRELADEMNRESTSGKLEVLGLQALRALGLEDKGWSDWSLSSTVSLAAQQHWLDAPPPYPSKSAGGPFAAAESAARLAGKSGGLKDQPGHPPELAAAAGVPQVDLWSTPAGAAAHGLLAEVEAGTLSAADAIKLLVGVGVPDTTSLHEVQDVRKMLGRLAPRAGRPQ